MNCDCSFCQQAAQLGERAAFLQYKSQDQGSINECYRQLDKLRVYCKSAKNAYDEAYRVEAAYYVKPEVWR